jgi:hypothetical protein
MTGAPGTNRVALGTGQRRGTTDKEVEPRTNKEIDVKGKKEGVEGENDIIIADSVEETEMGATTFDN